MSWFNILKKKPPEPPPLHAVASSTERTRIGNLDQLLAAEDSESAVIAIDEFLNGVLREGLEVSSLTPAQRVFLFVEDFEREMNNGGIRQYFSNSSGDHAAGCVEALKTVGRSDAATLLSRAIKDFPDSAPSPDREARNEFLETLNEKIEERWEGLDERYYEKIGSLAPALIAYVRDHRAEF
jgi:hypothetical protein